MAGDPAGAAGGHAQRGQHPHGGGLAGAVGTEQAEHGALGHDEAHPVDRDGVPEVLDEIDGLDGQLGAHRSTPPHGTDRQGRSAEVFTPGRTGALPRTHRWSGRSSASSAPRAPWRPAAARASCAGPARWTRSSYRPRRGRSTRGST